MRFPLPSVEYRRIRHAIYRFMKVIPPEREFATISLLKELARPTDIFVDVGANRGQLTRHISPLVAETFCVEPIPRLARYLRACGYTVYQFAADEKNGTARFFVNRSDVCSSLYPHQHTKDIIEVRTRRLDSLFSRIDVLKVDVEGAEGRVLAGLGPIRPRVLCIEFIPEHKGYDHEIFQGLLDEYPHYEGRDSNFIFWDEEVEE